jgi:carbamoyltransferase
VLGLSCFYHNSAAALIKDGQIIAAAEEERFSRVKNDRRFPAHSVNYCLEEAGIHQSDLAAVVYYDNAAMTFERLMHTLAAVGERGEDQWSRVLPSWLRYKLNLPQLIRREMRYDGPVLQELHHRSHAASAFYPSPFEEAAIITIDGVGEWATATIGVGRGQHVELLKEMRFPHSLGLLYSAFTQFTGFKVNSGEYKMMGLAPYGRPKYVQQILDHLIKIHDDGSIELNMEYFGFLDQPSMTNDKFAALFDGPPPEVFGLDYKARDGPRALRAGRHRRGAAEDGRLCAAADRHEEAVPGRRRRAQLRGQRPAPARRPV